MGSGFSPRSQADSMIMPGVQKPHWRPCWSQNACWSGWSLPPTSMPSMVVISAPSAWTASIVQRLRAPAVHVDRARAAVAGVAAGVRAGEPEHVAQEVDEEEARLDVGLADLAVDGDARCAASSSPAPMRTRGRARRPSGAPARSSRDHRSLVVGGTVASATGSALRPAAAAPAARNASSPGCLPASVASASVAANGGLGDRGHADPGPGDRAVARRADDRGGTRRGEVAGPPLELRGTPRRAAGPDPGTGPRRGPPSARCRRGTCRGRSRGPAISRSPPALAADDRGVHGERTPPASPTRGPRGRPSRRSCPSCGPAGRRSPRQTSWISG